ncbi:endonuclease [Candidatus Desulfofervidus auxilii]|uniref:Endonuclease n=2 Tax=Desulfofervidus auxilii TaxID=1621989 RepID=A0A7U4QK74_DESA2|nr:endonuclease [Candidatus Desulfofervidus auxilii]CAD7774917.1 Staphylococcal nuclease homologue [Candidatus Methanoperedenaceae archaeon GB50]CAD7776412.1 Staphylococcal nuclease homologue [Candidatus Methanoperedenaceae archaeon GB37]
MNMTSRKVSLIALLVFTISLLPAFIHAQQRHVATILKISDGDTIWVLMNREKVKLRLIGIDTPEKFSSKKLECEAAECQVSLGYMKSLGQMVTHYAKTLLHRGQKVKLVIYDRGYYGRALTLIYLPDGTCYNERIVADGYACVYKYRGHKSRELPWDEWFRLNQLLEEVKENRRGLWEGNYKVMECLCR